MKFTKLQGLGNDFLIIPVGDVKRLKSPEKLAQTICERHYGAGADGVVFVAATSHDEAEFASRIFNADGSEAEISGNGTRCVAAYFYYQGLWSEPAIRIATIAGVKTGRLVRRDRRRFDFEFAMGKPKLASAEIPMHLDESLERVVSYPLIMGGDLQEITCTSMGNPHCSVFVSRLEEFNIDELGSLLEHHPAFPFRTNVEFVQVNSRDEIAVRFWERGVGRTLSSGTGSCGAAIAAMLNGYTERAVSVKTPGGTLQVVWQDDDTVNLTGSAEVIYEGVWLDESV
ncbi:MAG: diaminopimelate epimerase [Acidobacteria bacterium]|nr:diaminopimelate epimerase [Acidobacteriota bacterium]